MFPFKVGDPPLPVSSYINPVSLVLKWEMTLLPLPPSSPFSRTIVLQPSLTTNVTLISSSFHPCFPPFHSPIHTLPPLTGALQHLAETHQAYSFAALVARFATPYNIEPSEKSGPASAPFSTESSAKSGEPPLLHTAPSVVTWSSFCQLIRPSGGRSTPTSSMTPISGTTSTPTSLGGSVAGGGDMDMAQLAPQDETNLLAKHR